MRYLVRILAAMELLSGVYNLGFFAASLTQTAIGNAPYRGAVIIIGCVGVALNILAIVAGVELWKGTSLGRRLSLAVQAIQLPKLFLRTLFFTLSFGPDAYALFKLYPSGEVFFTITLQPMGQQLFYFLFESRDVSTGVGVSLVSCAWIGVLMFYQPEAYAPAEPISSSALTRPQRFLCWAVTIAGLCEVVTGLAGNFLWPLMDYGNPNFPEALNSFMRQQPIAPTPVPAWKVVAFGVPTAAIGFLCLRAKRWAFWLLFLMFLPQCVEYVSTNFSFSLMGPLTANFNINRSYPPTRLSINILAVIVCILAAGTALSLRRRQAEGPQSAARIEPSF